MSLNHFETIYFIFDFKKHPDSKFCIVKDDFFYNDVMPPFAR